MSYIGNTPTTTAFITDTFSGNNSTTAFTMSVAPANTSSCLVAISGVLQDPTAYSVSGTTITFSAAPPTGTGNISVRYLGIPASGVTTTAYRTVTDFTATAGQTTFSPPSYTVGYINVFRNGVRLGAADYTASNGTTVVLGTGATVGDLITTESFYVSSVLNALQTTGGTINGPTGATPLIVQANGTTGLTVDSSANVNINTKIGIGTTSPTRKLNISGAGVFSSSTAPAIRLDNTVSGRPALIDFDDTENLNIWSSTDTGTIKFLTNTGAGTERARIDLTTLTLTNLQGIKFQATQSPSTDPNTLDDYEEGTFTPTAVTSTGTATYDYREAWYRKVGDIVMVGGIIGVNNSSSLTGTIQIGNLPFTIKTGTNYQYGNAGCSADGQGFTWPIRGQYSISFITAANSTGFKVRGIGPSGTVDFINYNDPGVAANWYFRFQLTYPAA